jgi:hypothetical protein
LSRQALREQARRFAIEKPTTSVAGCAFLTSGHAAAAPAKRVMNWRRESFDHLVGGHQEEFRG